MRDRIQCRECGDVIESKNTHDFVWCACRSVAVDGGPEYKKRVGQPANIRELDDDWTEDDD